VLVTLGRSAERDLREQPPVLARVLDVNAAGLDAARALLARSGGVRLLAIGSSRHAAGIGAAAVESRAGVPCTVLPAPGAAVPAFALRPDHVVVAVSQSGETPSLLAAVAAARAAGCPVVSVTNAPGSALAALADVALDCAAGPERVVAATKSVTAQALLVSALAGPLPVGPLVDAVTALLATDLEAFARGAPPDHVVAGGLGAEWVADEVALKFAEMTGRLPSADSLVEHLHGPAAAPGTTLAFVDPRDPNAAALGGHVVRVGPDASYDVVTPFVDDAVAAAVVALVAGQCAALAWSRRAGADADAPRGLSKVTRSA
jgi:glucosamine--fructose-6-phosphate aminotransferase (isomerizing)